MPVGGLTGLNALAGYNGLIAEQNQATPEERMGGVADPNHGKPLAEDYIRRGMQAGEPRGPYGPDNQLLGDESWFWEGGGDPSEDPAFDYTPNTHAGPWLKGIQSGAIGDVGPDMTALKLQQLAGLHSLGRNGSARLEHAHTQEALNDEWQTIDQLNSGSTLTEACSRQSMSGINGWGTRDRTTSMAAQNSYGFDSAHQFRRWATGGIPGNNMWLRPGGRPMMKSMAGPARPPIGPNSPFAGQDLGQAFGIDGAVLQSLPSEYVTPPQPTLAKPDVSATGNDAIVEWY